MGVLDPDTVSKYGRNRGWYEHDYQWSQGELVILRKADHNNDTMQLNVWCTTGTVGSYITHPRQRKTQLFRRSIDSYAKLVELLDNPRAHTGGGYHRTQDAPAHESTAPRQRNVACPGCGKRYFTMGDSAQHFESGHCSSCPGMDNARKTMYSFARQKESAAGADGMFTSGQRLLAFGGDGELDWTAGYVNGGKNYHCPSCSKAFVTMNSMLQHVQSKEECRQRGGYLALT